MKFLFVHQNMPGQYVHIARHLAQSGHEVSFITQPRVAQIARVRKLEYQPPPPSGDGHAYTRELERGLANGLAVARLCEWLARDGLCRTS
jgi:Glycosyl transferase family 4 group